jgi:hypothetical protein
MRQWIVGKIDPPKRLKACVSYDEAVRFIETLPNFEDGIYYLDGPERSNG